MKVYTLEGMLTRFNRSYSQAEFEQSAVAAFRHLIPAMPTLNGLTLLEIGTWRGFAAAGFAMLGAQVITVDVQHITDVTPVEDMFGLHDRITRFVGGQRAIDAFVAQQQFDLAFIDGNHTARNGRHDWKLVKRCGLVYFHDYAPTMFPDLTAFLDEIGAVPISCEYEPHFAMWRESQ